MTRPSDTVFPLDARDKLKNESKLKVERCDSERALLCFLLAKLGKADPDLVVGHGLLCGDLDILVHRLAHLKIPNWSRIGRLKRANIPPPGKVCVNQYFKISLLFPLPLSILARGAAQPPVM